MQNFSKYDFRGYRLLKANLSRVKDKAITSFTLLCQKGVYNEENQIYEIISEITVSFGDEVNVFVFSAGFKINDLEWLEVMAEQTVVKELFTVAFPFLREKVFEFTSDFRPGFMMPIIDLSKFDITKKTVFNLNRAEPLAN
jgi:hypothetical protein